MDGSARYSRSAIQPLELWRATFHSPQGHHDLLFLRSNIIFSTRAHHGFLLRMPSSIASFFWTFLSTWDLALAQSLSERCVVSSSRTGCSSLLSRTGALFTGLTLRTSA